MPPNQGEDVQRTLGRIEGLLLSIDQAIRAHFLDDEKNFESLRRRVEGAEKKLNYFAGAWAVVGALGMYLWKGIH